MHSDHVFRPTRGFSDTADGNGGGVAGEYDSLVPQKLDLSKHAVLQIEILEHRLDDDIASGELGILRANRQARRNAVSFLTSHSLSLHPLVQPLANLFESALGALAVAILEHHLHSGAISADEADADAHEARSDNGDTIHLARLYAGVFNAAVFFQRVGGKKDIDQLASLRADRQIAEGLGLGAQSGLAPALEADAHDFQNAQRRRIVTAGFCQRRFSRLAEQQMPAQRGLGQQPVRQPRAGEDGIHRAP